jgi:hypothetical protein
MALGDLGDNLAIIGAEFIKSCMCPASIAGARIELMHIRVHNVRLR